MTYDELIAILKSSEQINSISLPELKDMVDLYPYFFAGRLFLAKASLQSNDVLSDVNLKIASLYASDRRWLYYYIHPEKKISSEPYRRTKSPEEGGGYFDMITRVESGPEASENSLKKLAERLKSARTLVTSSVQRNIPARLSPVRLPHNQKDLDVEIAKKDPPKFSHAIQRQENSEDDAKKMIKEQKYREAIEILKVLSLNNPKKSVYFADQIRFLEKIIANSKK